MLKFASKGLNTLSINFALCSAPVNGKLHHTSPQPYMPLLSVIFKINIGLLSITPNDVITGLDNG